MNSELKSIKILCYGDSNTRGQVPFEPVRYKVSERWTTLVQDKLNSKNNKNLVNYETVEEGLGARTAGNIDFDKPEINGVEYFKTNILGVIHFDVAIIALGTNDFKTKYNRTSAQVYADLIKYQKLVKQNFSPETKIIYLLPPNISTSIYGFENYHQKLQKLVDLFNNDQNDNLNFIDLSNFKVTGADGLHFSIEDHRKLVKLLLRRYF